MTTVTTYIHVIDQYGNPVSCRVNIPGAYAPDTCSTGDDGIATFELDEGEWYTASVLPLDGYTLLPEESTESFPAAASDIMLHVNKISPTPPGTTHQLIISLKPLSWADRDGLILKMPEIISKVMGVILPYTSKYEVVGDGQFVNDNIIINLRKVR